MKTNKEKTKKTCEYCGKSNYRKYFMGRFCGKVCIAKHAVATRKKRPSNKDLKINHQTKKVFCSQENGISSNDQLKLRIRLSSSTKLKSERRAFKNQSRHGFSHFRKRKLSDVMDEVISDFRTFNWNNYLTQTKSKALSAHEFELITGRNAYPLIENPFKVGYYLEAVDPMHQSLICLVSVAQVEGFRMRLHFEGYLEPFDFWVNADSPLIFPCGFCKDTGRTLSAPEGWDKNKRFDIGKAFSEKDFTNKTNFKVGDKLEAVDRKHQDLLCVATVADIIGDYVLIHFDGWEKDYDYWVNNSSPFIHPVGWCEANQHLLTAPPSYDPNATFIWKEYLEKTSSIPANSSCFAPQNCTYEKNTKIEVVDQNNPILVRVATIVDVTNIRVKVHFDGWNDIFDHWIDIDSSDIHPINWCLKAGFPLHPPVNCEMIYKKPCPTTGCSGLGHSNLPGNLAYHKKHYTEHGCPYSLKNLGKHALFDRFSSHLMKEVNDCNTKQKNFDQQCYVRKRPKPSQSRQLFFESSDFKRPKLRRNISFQPNDYNKSRVMKNLNYSKSPSHPKIEDTVNDNSRSLKEKVVRSSVLSSLASLTTLHLPHCWDKNVRHLPGVDGLKSSHVSMWDLKKVTTFIETLTGKVEYADIFEREEIDGEALLLLTQNDIIKTLKIKLGPAVKIYNAVLLFKVLDDSDVD